MSRPAAATADRTPFAVDAAVPSPAGAPTPAQAGRPSREPSTATGSRGLTTRGRCLVAGGIAAAICGVILDERDLLRVGILAVALPVVAFLVTALRRPTLAASHRAIPSRLARGTAGTVELRLRNIGRQRSRAATVTDAPAPGLTAGVRGWIPPLKRGATAVIRYPLQARRRGRFTIGAVQVLTGDPFGLCQRTRAIDSQVQVLVLPVVVPLIGTPPSAGSRSAAGGATQRGTAGGDPDARVRPYAPGDDVRTIHWRASARREDLVVRTRESVSHGGAAVFLDHRAATHRGRGASSSLEFAVSLAASISAHLLDGDYQLRLITHQGRLIAAGNDVADDVLIGLAEITPDVPAGDDGSERTGARPAGELRTGQVGDVGLLCAVTGALSDDDARRLAAGKPAGARGIAFVVDGDAWAAASGKRPRGESALEPARGGEDPRRTGPIGAASAVLGAAGWRVLPIRPGADIATLWREACGLGQGGIPVADPAALGGYPAAPGSGAGTPGHHGFEPGHPGFDPGGPGIGGASPDAAYDPQAGWHR